ncbi:hypothetical protein BU202_05065 [Streptococcus cuniculi]|uniref:Uncharacterized protein n=1 Tax=Streptococcus cuniculi TaxID=1432788 RepID=A0A1Q8E7R6_9STRE|nr:hypothetical protein [Streptococcus cuniculi]OLF47839.1 hypothetical protein BU202_05065 [Streptococcus cuniculi]
MTKKTLFNASFEESLNLEDDQASSEFIEKNLAETQEKEKYRGTFKSYVWLVFLTILCIFGPNWLLYKGSHYIFGHTETNLLQPATYNFLPGWLFLTLGTSWLIIILIGKKFYQQFILIYRGQFHLFVTYFLWLLIEWNLFCLTAFYTTLGFLGVSSFFLANVYIGYLIIKSRSKDLLNLMYRKVGEARQKRNAVFGKSVNRLMSLLGLLSLFWFCIKSFIHFKMEVESWLAILVFLIFWFFVNSAMILYESYVVLPFMLRGFYRLKYPEEYREWEGKSLEEWYGKKYLKKHKERLDNDTD